MIWLNLSANNIYILHSASSDCDDLMYGWLDTFLALRITPILAILYMANSWKGQNDFEPFTIHFFAIE